MEIIVKSSVLKKECEKIEGILPTKPAIMITNGMLFEVKDTGVFLTATDLENTLRLNLECDKVKKGSMVIIGKKFISLIKQLPDTDIKIIRKENSAEIMCNDSKYTFPCMNEEEFPKLPKFSGDVSIKVNGKQLSKAIDNVRFCIDPEEPRPHFRGGLLDIKEDSLNFIGTDTKRLSLVSINTGEKYVNPYKCLLPFKLMGILTTLANKDEVIDLSIGKNQIVFNLGNMYLVSQLLSGSEDFPDYGKVIPNDKQQKHIYINKEEFLSTLKRISLFTSERYNKVRLTIGKNILVFSVVSPDVGEAHEKIDIEYSDEKEQSLAFPPNYLIDFLHKVEEERVVIGFNNEKTPIIMRGEKNSDYIYVAMPLKLD
jgi:DNA polymerase III subunit beta